MLEHKTMIFLAWPGRVIYAAVHCLSVGLHQVSGLSNISADYTTPLYFRYWFTRQDHTFIRNRTAANYSQLQHSQH